MAADNVVVHFNYPSDTIYIGQTNIMEIWIENDDSVLGMALGFEFRDYVGTIVWDSAYGNYPPVNQENDAVGAFLFNTAPHSMYDLVQPDSLLIGGTYLPSTIPGLPPNSLRKCYTLKFDVPSGEPAGSLCVDNIFVPPAGSWIFDDGTSGFPPDYHGCVNSSPSNPDCPAVCFPVIERNYVCGDANNDTMVNVADLVYIINYVFQVGPEPFVYLAGDATCNGRVNIADAGYIMEYLFMGGPEPCYFCPKD